MDDPKNPLVGIQFTEVKKLKGAFIVAPQYRVRMWGNFATVGGTVVAAQFQMGRQRRGHHRRLVIQMRDDVAPRIDGTPTWSSPAPAPPSTPRVSASASTTRRSLGASRSPRRLAGTANIA
jgi:hypothetical protein